MKQPHKQLLSNTRNVGVHTVQLLAFCMWTVLLRIDCIAAMRLYRTAAQWHPGAGGERRRGGGGDAWPLPGRRQPALSAQDEHAAAHHELLAPDRRWPARW